MASIRKLPSGLHQAVVKRNGRRITRTDPRRKVVADWAKDTELAIDRGVWKDPRAAAAVTLADWHGRWVRSRLVELETSRGDDSMWRLHIAPTLGQRPVGELTRLDVQTWVSDLHRSGVGPAAVRRAYNLLRVCLGGAEDEGHLEVNPCRRITLPPNPPKLPDWFTHEEVEAIVEALPEPHSTMTALMCWVGLRWGEAAGLRIGDVDWLRQRVTVVGSMTQAGQWKEYPKNSSSRREVPAPRWVLEAMTPMAAGRGRGDLLFVTRRQSRAMSGSNWRKWFWQPALERAGVAYRPPHTCRHTAASWLVQEGTPLYEVQRQLGHSSATTTERYAHLSPERHAGVLGAWEKRRAHEGRTDLEVGGAGQA